MKTTKPPFLRRVYALLIDYLFILVWMGAIGITSFVLFVVAGDGYPDYLGMFGPLGTQLLFFLLLTVPIGVYLYATESGRYHATLGKRKAGLRVVSVHEAPLSKMQVFWRTIVKLLPWEIAHTFVWQLQYVFYTHGYQPEPPVWVMIGLSGSILLAAIYVLMVLLRKDARGPHDLVAGTHVEIARTL